jgi:hypothetical protein
MVFKKLKKKKKPGYIPTSFYRKFFSLRSDAEAGKRHNKANQPPADD